MKKSNNVQTYVDGVLTYCYDYLVVKTIPVGENEYKLYSINRCIFNKYHSITCTTCKWGFEVRRQTTFYDDKESFNKAIIRISKMNLVV